ncbi:hypothetical protein PCE1_002254 [Barthelona sp. PCE]
MPHYTREIRNSPRLNITGLQLPDIKASSFDELQKKLNLKVRKIDENLSRLPEVKGFIVQPAPKEDSEKSISEPEVEVVKSTDINDISDIDFSDSITETDFMHTSRPSSYTHTEYPEYVMHVPEELDAIHEFSEFSTDMLGGSSELSSDELVDDGTFPGLPNSMSPMITPVPIHAYDSDLENGIIFEDIINEVSDLSEDDIRPVGIQRDYLHHITPMTTPVVTKISAARLFEGYWNTPMQYKRINREIDRLKISLQEEAKEYKMDNRIALGVVDLAKSFNAAQKISKRITKDDLRLNEASKFIKDFFNKRKKERKKRISQRKKRFSAPIKQNQQFGGVSERKRRFSIESTTSLASNATQASQAQFSELGIPTIIRNDGSLMPLSNFTKSGNTEGEGVLADLGVIPEQPHNRISPLPGSDRRQSMMVKRAHELKNANDEKFEQLLKKVSTTGSQLSGLSRSSSSTSVQSNTTNTTADEDGNIYSIGSIRNLLGVQKKKERPKSTLNYDLEEGSYDYTKELGFFSDSDSDALRELLEEQEAQREQEEEMLEEEDMERKQAELARIKDLIAAAKEKIDFASILPEYDEDTGYGAENIGFLKHSKVQITRHALQILSTEVSSLTTPSGDIFPMVDERTSLERASKLPRIKGAKRAAWEPPINVKNSFKQCINRSLVAMGLEFDDFDFLDEDGSKHLERLFELAGRSNSPLQSPSSPRGGFTTSDLSDTQLDLPPVMNTNDFLQWEVFTHFMPGAFHDDMIESTLLIAKQQLDDRIMKFRKCEIGSNKGKSKLLVPLTTENHGILTVAPTVSNSGMATPSISLSRHSSFGDIDRIVDRSYSRSSSGTLEISIPSGSRPTSPFNGNAGLSQYSTAFSDNSSRLEDFDDDDYIECLSDSEYYELRKHDYSVKIDRIDGQVSVDFSLNYNPQMEFLYDDCAFRSRVKGIIIKTLLEDRWTNRHFAFISNTLVQINFNDLTPMQLQMFNTGVFSPIIYRAQTGNALFFPPLKFNVLLRRKGIIQAGTLFEHKAKEKTPSRVVLPQFSVQKQASLVVMHSNSEFETDQSFMQKLKSSTNRRLSIRRSSNIFDTLTDFSSSEYSGQPQLSKLQRLARSSRADIDDWDSNEMDQYRTAALNFGSIGLKDPKALNSEYITLIELGQSAFQSGDFVLALRYLIQSIGNVPERWEGFMIRGSLLYCFSLLDHALSDFQLVAEMISHILDVKKFDLTMAESHNLRINLSEAYWRIFQINKEKLSDKEQIDLLKFVCGTNIKHHCARMNLIRLFSKADMINNAVAHAKVGIDNSDNDLFIKLNYAIVTSMFVKSDYNFSHLLKVFRSLYYNVRKDIKKNFFDRSMYNGESLLRIMMAIKLMVFHTQVCLSKSIFELSFELLKSIFDFMDFFNSFITKYERGKVKFKLEDVVFESFKCNWESIIEKEIKLFNICHIFFSFASIMAQQDETKTRIKQQAFKAHQAMINLKITDAQMHKIMTDSFCTHPVLFRKDQLWKYIFQDPDLVRFLDTLKKPLPPAAFDHLFLVADNSVDQSMVALVRSIMALSSSLIICYGVRALLDSVRFFSGFAFNKSIAENFEYQHNMSSITASSEGSSDYGHGISFSSQAASVSDFNKLLEETIVENYGIPDSQNEVLKSTISNMNIFSILSCATTHYLLRQLRKASANLFSIPLSSFFEDKGAHFDHYLPSLTLPARKFFPSAEFREIATKLSSSEEYRFLGSVFSRMHDHFERFFNRLISYGQQIINEESIPDPLPNELLFYPYSMLKLSLPDKFEFYNNNLHIIRMPWTYSVFADFYIRNHGNNHIQKCPISNAERLTRLLPENGILWIMLLRLQALDGRQAARESEESFTKFLTKVGYILFIVLKIKTTTAPDEKSVPIEVFSYLRLRTMELLPYLFTGQQKRALDSGSEMLKSLLKFRSYFKGKQNDLFYTLIFKICNQLGLAAAEIGEFQRAIKYYETALRYCGNPSKFLNIVIRECRLLIERNAFVECLNILRKHQKQFSGDIRFKFFRALCYFKLKDFEEAKKYITLVLELAHGPTHNLLADNSDYDLMKTCYSVCKSIQAYIYLMENKIDLASVATLNSVKFVNWTTLDLLSVKFMALQFEMFLRSRAFYKHSALLLKSLSHVYSNINESNFMEARLLRRVLLLRTSSFLTTFKTSCMLNSSYLNYFDIFSDGKTKSSKSMVKQASITSLNMIDLAEKIELENQRNTVSVNYFQNKDVIECIRDELLQLLQLRKRLDFEEHHDWMIEFNLVLVYAFNKNHIQSFSHCIRLIDLTFSPYERQRVVELLIYLCISFFEHVKMLPKYQKEMLRALRDVSKRSIYVPHIDNGLISSAFFDISKFISTADIRVLLRLVQRFYIMDPTNPIVNQQLAILLQSMQKYQLSNTFARSAELAQCIRMGQSLKQPKKKKKKRVKSSAPSSASSSRSTTPKRNGFRRKSPGMGNRLPSRLFNGTPIYRFHSPASMTFGRKSGGRQLQSAVKRAIIKKEAEPARTKFIRRNSAGTKPKAKKKRSRPAYVLKPSITGYELIPSFDMVVNKISISAKHLDLFHLALFAHRTQNILSVKFSSEARKAIEFSSLLKCYTLLALTSGIQRGFTSMLGTTTDSIHELKVKRSRVFASAMAAAIQFFQFGDMNGAIECSLDLWEKRRTFGVDFQLVGYILIVFFNAVISLHRRLHIANKQSSELTNKLAYTHECFDKGFQMFEFFLIESSEQALVIKPTLLLNLWHMVALGNFCLGNYIEAYSGMAQIAKVKFVNLGFKRFPFHFYQAVAHNMTIVSTILLKSNSLTLFKYNVNRGFVDLRDVSLIRLLAGHVSEILKENANRKGFKGDIERIIKKEYIELLVFSDLLDIELDTHKKPMVVLSNLGIRHRTLQLLEDLHKNNGKNNQEK